MANRNDERFFKEIAEMMVKRQLPVVRQWIAGRITAAEAKPPATILHAGKRISTRNQVRT